MRFPKTLTFGCLLAVSAAVGYSQTAEQQEKALRALRQLVAEKEGRATTPKVTPAPAVAPKTTPPPAAKPVVTPAAAAAPAQPPKAVAPAASSPASKPQLATQSTPSSLNDEKERKARAALDELRRTGGQTQTLTTTPAQTPAATAPAKQPDAKPKPVVTQTTTTPPPAATAPAVAAVPVVTSSPLSQSAEEKARAALDQLRATQPVVAATPEPAPAKVPSQPKATAKAAPAAKPASIVAAGPASTTAVATAAPVAITKKEKLQEILELYIADQISARDYHDRRAAILAGN